MGEYLVSCCCTAQPFFGIGVSYGVHLDEDGHYMGMCSKCRDHTQFVQILDSSGPKYQPPQEVKDANSKSNEETS